MSPRDKAILVGLYLSKHDKEGLKKLGFNSFQQAFNILGFALNSKPNSIKNYRDEFDPLFPNSRKGRHKRKIRTYCKYFYDNFNNLSFVEFSDLIKSFLIESYDSEINIHTEEEHILGSIAKRLLTGKAAEEYFKKEYINIQAFQNYQLYDTTLFACGYDYKLKCNSEFYCVEVKGLNALKGNLLLTEKEFYMAQKLATKYCLFVVKNFKEKPIHDIIFDPLNSQLVFKKVEKQIIQTNFTTYI